MNNIYYPKRHHAAQLVVWIYILIGFTVCEDEVFCTEDVPLQWKCTGSSLVTAVDMAASNVTHFYYEANELERVVYMSQANFSHFFQLEELHLSSTGLGAMYHEIEELLPNNTDIFIALSNLRELHLNINWRMHHPLPELLKPLVNLQVLDLSDTRMVNISNLAATISGLQNSTKLSSLNLWNMRNFEHAGSLLSLDLSDVLRHLKNAPLEYLNIGYNALRQITPPGLITFAPRLKELDVSNNMLIPLFTSSLFLEANMHPTLLTINMNQQMYRPTTRDKRSGNTGIAGLDKCPLLEDNPQMNLLRAMLIANHSLFCDFLYQFDGQSFGGIPCHIIPPFNELVTTGCSGCQVVPFVGAVKRIDLSQQNVYDEVHIYPEYQQDPQCFHSNSSLEFLDVSYNNDFGWIGVSDVFETEVTGLEKVQGFYVSDSGLEGLNPKLFWHFPVLHWVDMSHNFLHMTNASSIFINNTQLEHLDLSYNVIINLDDDLFKPLENLKFLDLSYNQIESFRLDLTGLLHLQFLGLSGNRIAMLDSAVMNQLDEIATVTPVSIKLSENNFICTCPSLRFMKWLKHDHHEDLAFQDEDSYLCRNKESTWDFVTNVKVSNINKECNQWIIYITIGVSSTIGIVLVIVCIIVIYRKRWRIRYLLYLARTSWQRRKEASVNVSYEYDAFISYNEEDRFWVHDKLRTTLEDQHGLKVCLHFRDFIPGEFIEDQIIESIMSSRKTVLILSPNFLKSKWCFFELQMARNRLFEEGSDVLLLVMLKPLPRTGITSTLAHLLESKVYLEWTEDSDGQKLFWAKLSEVIKTPRRNDLV